MKRPRRRTVLLCLSALVVLCAIAAIACDQWIAHSTFERVFNTTDAIPARDVGLVLGTLPIMPDGRSNLFFTHRIDAAAALFKTGKVRHLIVSGDNGTREYDETTAMKEALVAKGIPAAAITMDFAGFRTLDSVVRAKVVFGQAKLTIVSQAFHGQRALFIADHSGIDAVAFAAMDVGKTQGATVRLREVLARVRAVADALIGTRPKFTGAPEPITLGTQPESPSP